MREQCEANKRYFKVSHHSLVHVRSCADQQADNFLAASCASKYERCLRKQKIMSKWRVRVVESHGSKEHTACAFEASKESRH